MLWLKYRSNATRNRVCQHHRYLVTHWTLESTRTCLDTNHEVITLCNGGYPYGGALHTHTANLHTYIFMSVIYLSHQHIQCTMYNVHCTSHTQTYITYIYIYILCSNFIYTYLLTILTCILPT